MNTDITYWWRLWSPRNARLRSYLTFLLSSSYIIWHKVYQLFVYKDLLSRLRDMNPEWREVIFIFKKVDSKTFQLIICEPRNLTLARNILHGRQHTTIPKKVLKFPPLRPRRNSIYQQNPRQYEAKVCYFIIRFYKMSWSYKLDFT